MTKEFFPDGTLIDDWFYNTTEPKVDDFGKQYKITDFGVCDDGRIYTKEIQSLIDDVYKKGGGLIVVPPGTYMTGSLYFKQGVHLYIESGGTLKGSDNISDYNICETRIEGETCQYFDALINVDNTDGFTMFGNGTIDGNGLKAWKAFWLRRKWNEDCTNKDEQRPRLVYISNSINVTVYGLNLQNSAYWTNHIYKCTHVKFLNCRIFSPKEPVPSPSTDAIDIDACADVLIKNCYIHVNDDGFVLKGGKGPWADTLPENGMNERIIIEDCVCGFAHSCFTCGSEAIHCKNIIMRNIKMESGYNLLWFKIRPDTPQIYEQIIVDGVRGKADNFVHLMTWSQFYNLKDRKDRPLSVVRDVTVKNCKFKCNTYKNISYDEDGYTLTNFNMENLQITSKEKGYSGKYINNIREKEVCCIIEDSN